MGSLIWRDSEAINRIRQGATNGLRLAAEHLRQTSQAQCPHDEGILESTASVTVSAEKLYCVVSYDTPYAARQHEELTWRHPKKGKAKYLEDPLRDEAEILVGLIAAQIRKQTRG